MADQTKLGQFDRTLRNCRVIDIPAGATPKYISVRLPGENGELIDAWWTGSPRLAVNDYCKLLRQPDVPQYEIVGASGATAALPATHTHDADEITVDTAGFAGNLSAADDTVQKALDTLDDMPGGGGGWPFEKLTVSTTNANAAYSTLAAAITAAASSGDTIELDSETYSLSAQQTIGKSLTIVGQGVEQTVIDFDLADSACFDFTVDSITVIFRDLTIDHSAGAGTLSGALFTNNAGVKVILDNAIVLKSGGAPGTGYGAWWLAGTLELRNGSKLLCTSGTAQYGFLNDSSGDVTLIVGAGCEVGGATDDVYTNRAGSSLAIVGGILTNAGLTWAGSKIGYYYHGGDGSLNLLSALYGLNLAQDSVEVSKLVASDGSPDPALSASSTGALTTASDLTVVGNLVNDTGYTQVRQLVSKRNVSIADDTAVAQLAMAAGNRFLFGVVCNDAEWFFGVCTYNGITRIAKSTNFNIVAGGGTLTGTTGTDGYWNIRDNAGVLYIENRRGSTLNAGVTFFGSD